MQIPDRFDVAISFAGNDRNIAEGLANRLLSLGITVFYDRFFQSDLWGKDLYEHISDIYTNRARFCVILVSVHYLAKRWTRHERKSAQARAFAQGSEYILPVRLDDTELPGLPSTVGYLDLRELTIELVADFVGEKLGLTLTSESELRRRRSLIQERGSSVGSLPESLEVMVHDLVQKHDLVIASSSPPRRHSGRSVCSRCTAIYLNDNMYLRRLRQAVLLSVCVGSEAGTY